MEEPENTGLPTPLPNQRDDPLDRLRQFEMERGLAPSDLAGPEAAAPEDYAAERRRIAAGQPPTPAAQGAAPQPGDAGESAPGGGEVF